MKKNKKQKNVKKAKEIKTAIVCAWRNPEQMLSSTLESAAKSCGEKANIIAVEDTEGNGPARTRHHGIEHAHDADVIIIIDAHMQFRSDALAVMARHAYKNGLCCPITHHNAQCVFDGDGGKYYGAKIVYRAEDGNQRTALAGKWAEQKTCGEVGEYRDWET